MFVLPVKVRTSDWGLLSVVGPNDSKDALNRPAGIAVDDAANEVYVADGFGNKRVVVFDATTGAYKRQWNGAGADAPSPCRPSRSRRSPVQRSECCGGSAT